MKIYVVCGSTGRNDTYKEWPVEAFSRAYKAKTLLSLAATAAKNMLDDSVESDKRIEGLYEIFGHNPYDPDFLMDCSTGTKYVIREFELPVTRETCSTK